MVGWRLSDFAGSVPLLLCYRHGVKIVSPAANSCSEQLLTNSFFGRLYRARLSLLIVTLVISHQARSACWLTALQCGLSWKHPRARWKSSWPPPWRSPQPGLRKPSGLGAWSAGLPQREWSVSRYQWWGPWFIRAETLTTIQCLKKSRGFIICAFLEAWGPPGGSITLELARNAEPLTPPWPYQKTLSRVQQYVPRSKALPGLWPRLRLDSSCRRESGWYLVFLVPTWP
jgi:hypothetical protein